MIAFVATTFAALPPGVSAQTIRPALLLQTSPADDQLTAELIESRKQAAAESPDLNEEQKKQADGHYTVAANALMRIEELNTGAAQFEQGADTVQQRLQMLRDRLNELQKLELVVPVDLELAELEQERARRNVALTELKAALASSEAEPARRDNRQADIRTQLLSASQRSADINKQLTTAAPDDEPQLLTLARVTELRARLQLIAAEGPALENELALYDAEKAANLLTWQRDVHTQEVALAEKELLEFDEEIERLRKQANAAALVRARIEAIAAQPLLQDDAKRNQALAEEVVSLNAPIATAKTDLQDAESRLEDLQRRFAETQQKVESIGLPRWIGELLRRQKKELRELVSQQSDVHDRREIVEDAQKRLFGHDDQRRQLASRDELLEAIMNRAPADMPPVEREKLEEAARDVLNNRAGHLDQLIASYRTLRDTLSQLEETEQAITAEADRYRTYIDERVLWIRSDNALFSSPAVDTTDGWLLSPTQWGQVLARLIGDLRMHPWLYALVLLTTGVLLILRPLCYRHLAAAGQLAQRGTCTTFRPTLRAAWLTVLLAALWPGVVWFFAMRLPLVTFESPFVFAVGQGLMAVAWGYLPLELLLQICRRDGLADHHFDWPESTIQLFRRTVPRLTLCGLPLAFVTATLYASESQFSADAAETTDSIERIGFVATTVLLALFLRSVLRPETGILREYLVAHPDGWLDRLKFFWYWGAVLSPLCLAGLTVAGFYFTAQQLAWRLFATITFVLSVQLVRAFLERLLIVQRRKLSIEQARKRRLEQAERQAASTQPDGSDSATAPAVVVPVEELHDDVQRNTEQSRRLVSLTLIVTSLVGVWMIWIDVLPALRILDQWPLWSARVQVAADEVTPGTPGILSPSGDSSTGTIEVVRAVTPRDVFLAILLAMVTFAAARNVPGLMEMWILQQLPLDQSVRYAITTLTRYVIILLGIVVSFNAVYIGWSKVQWLATALTFGLGFGLQEIFANFVAGLILLFERPIRIGDVVTVDDISGVVSRIRIRATTITDWDRKEYVIPNREFITGRTLNWTLTDKVNRLVINVGIAYGSDVDQAKALLKKVCSDHPLTLTDPGTSVTFSGFGDSTLNLVVRTYLPDLDNRLGVTDALHTQIDNAFREAGIEIAFPQQDLHLRSIDEPAARALRGNSASESEAA